MAHGTDSHPAPNVGDRRLGAGGILPASGADPGLRRYRRHMRTGLVREGRPGRARLVGMLIAAVVAAALTVPAGAAVAARPRATTDETFAVGRRDVTFVDSSRPTAANGTYAGAPTRTLPVRILYPAQTDGTGTTPVPDRRFPLVVFAHGFTANGPVYEGALLREIAAAGYVVAAPTFPLSNGGAPGGPTPGDYVNQPGDVSFVITQMLRGDSTSSDPLYRTIARRHVGVGGHSLGAVTTLGVTENSCCRDRRIDAAFPISGFPLPFPGGTYYTGLTPPPTPVLLVHGNADQTAPFVGSTLVYTNASAPKYLETLIGAPHVPFVDPWHATVVHTITDFLDRYLKRRPGAAAALGRDGNVPGVATLQATPRPTG